MIYDLLPLDTSPERAEILSTLMRKVAAHETFFSDYEGTCEEGCIEADATLVEMCEHCKRKMQTIAMAIMEPTSRSWEVWRTNGTATPENVGLVLFSDINPGIDATGHYIFFDGRLSDKTEVLQSLIDWLFEDHPEEGWKALQRLTVEIPLPFAALARHASRKLGFGGPFRYNISDNTQIRIEGIKKHAVMWRGSPKDLLILGLQRHS